MSQKAQQLLAAALARHPSTSTLGQKDFTRVRKFLQYVFGEANNNECDKQRCFQQADHAILPVVGVLFPMRDIEVSTVPTIQAFCSEASKSIKIKSLLWRDAPELWTSCLGTVSDSDIYLNFRKTAVHFIRNCNAGPSSDASTPLQEVKIGQSGAPVTIPSDIPSNDPTPKMTSNADATLMAALSTNTGEDGATLIGSQEAGRGKRRIEEPECRASKRGNRTPTQETPQPLFNISHDNVAALQFSQSGPGQNPTFQTYNTGSPSVYAGPQRRLWHVLCMAPTDRIAAWLSGVELIPSLARLRETDCGFCNIAQCCLYTDDVVEIEMNLGNASKESCLQAADQIREMYRGLLGVSIAVEEVRQMKIVVPPSSEAKGLISMFI